VNIRLECLEKRHPFRFLDDVHVIDHAERQQNLGSLIVGNGRPSRAAADADHQHISGLSCFVEQLDIPLMEEVEAADDTHDAFPPRMECR